MRNNKCGATVHAQPKKRPGMNSLVEPVVMTMGPQI